MQAFTLQGVFGTSKTVSTIHKSHLNQNILLKRSLKRVLPSREVLENGAKCDLQMSSMMAHINQDFNLEAGQFISSISAVVTNLL